MSAVPASIASAVSKAKKSSGSSSSSSTNFVLVKNSLSTSTGNHHDTESVPLLPAEEGPRRHQFDSTAHSSSQSYFPTDGIMKELFSRDNRMLRLRLCAIWGLMSLILGYFILRWSFDYTSGKSFFIAATTLTTIGYGPLFESNKHHNFLSYFSLFHVMPFLFLELLVSNDMCDSFSDQIKVNIAARITKGDTAARAFKAELSLATISCFMLIIILLLAGAVIYKFFADQDWTEGIFYAITSATSIGYGSFDVEDDEGYYGIGVYAILCNLSVTGIIFPQLASFWIRAAENIEEAKLHEKLLQAVPRSSYHKTRSNSLLISSSSMVGHQNQGNTFDHSNNSKTNVTTTMTTSFDRSGNGEKEKDKDKKSKRSNNTRRGSTGATALITPLTGVSMGYNQPTTGMVDTMSNLAASVAAISSARVSSTPTTDTSSHNNNALNESKV